MIRAADPSLQQCHERQEMLVKFFFVSAKFAADTELRYTEYVFVQLNTWDDHDIFDGWGSYPPHLQNCSAFGQVFRLAKKMYAAFQMHTTVKTQKSDGYFTAQVCSLQDCTWHS